MEKIKKYILVKRTYIDAFNDLVTQYLNSGWELYGSPFYDQNHYHQAVVKVEDVPDDVDPELGW